MAHSANLALAHHLADLAAEIAQRHRTAGPPAARIKDDGSPVTDADHEVEHTLRSRIRQEHPDDEFLGEESGGSETAHRRWIIDGTDGTANYLAGEPEWSTLIALEERDEITLGMVSAPALDRRWWAVPGHGSWTAPQSTRSGSPARRLSIAEGGSLRDAVIGIWPPPPRLSPAQRALAATLAARAAHTRPALDWSGVDPAARDPSGEAVRRNRHLPRRPPGGDRPTRRLPAHDRRTVGYRRPYTRRPGSRRRLGRV
jgi:histidinol-phosphatase